MDRVHEFLEMLKHRVKNPGSFLGSLNILIGRRVTKTDDTLVSQGITWRTLADALKKVRWDPEAVRDLGLNPADLPPRDRQRYWYTAIRLAQVDSEQARAAGDRLVEELRTAGYVIGPRPGQTSQPGERGAN